MFNYKPSTQPCEPEYPSLPVTYWLFIYLIPDIYESVTAPDTALHKGIICIHCLCPVLFEQHRHGGTVPRDKVKGWLSWGQIYMCCYRLACDCERWNASYQKYKYTKYTDRKKVIVKSQFDQWVQHQFTNWTEFKNIKTRLIITWIYLQTKAMWVKMSHESVTIMIELDKPEWHSVTAGNGDELNLHRSGQSLRVVTDSTRSLLSPLHSAYQPPNPLFLH